MFAHAFVTHPLREYYHHSNNTDTNSILVSCVRYDTVRYGTGSTVTRYDTVRYGIIRYHGTAGWSKSKVLGREVRGFQNEKLCACMIHGLGLTKRLRGNFKAYDSYHNTLGLHHPRTHY